MNNEKSDLNMFILDHDPEIELVVSNHCIESAYGKASTSDSGEMVIDGDVAIFRNGFSHGNAEYTFSIDVGTKILAFDYKDELDYATLYSKGGKLRLDACKGALSFNGELSSPLSPYTGISITMGGNEACKAFDVYVVACKGTDVDVQLYSLEDAEEGEVLDAISTTYFILEQPIEPTDELIPYVIPKVRLGDCINQIPYIWGNTRSVILENQSWIIKET